MKQKQAKRPLTREEALARQKRRQYQAQREAESRELARGPIDLPFLLLVVILVGIGLVMLFSASFPRAYYKENDPAKYLIRQGVFAIMGFAAMGIIGKINYQRYRALAKPLMILSVVLLVLVLIPGIGQVRNNARRWIGIGDILTFQPSEIAKFAVVLYFADTISKKKDKMRTLRYGVAPYVIRLGIIAVLMMMEPHLSGTLLILGVGAILMLAGGIRWIWVALAGGVGAVLGYLVVFVGGYGRSRIDMWLDPWLDRQGDGYQMVQSLLAIGSGGLTGTQWGHGAGKFFYLPEAHTDFAFAIFCQENGFIGAMILLLLFGLLGFAFCTITINARDRRGFLLAGGVTFLIIGQAVANMAMVCGILPVIGVPLIFISYGGSSMFLSMAASFF